MIVFESIRKDFMINNVNITNLNIVGNTVEQNGLPKSHWMAFCPEIKTEYRRCEFKILGRAMLYRGLSGGSNIPILVVAGLWKAAGT